MLKAGDKVKFLNIKGGGVVTRVLDSKTVLVATEDGFEIPTLISELLRMDPGDAGGRFFEENYNVSAPGETQDKEAGDDRSKPLPESARRNRKKEEIFLAFIPHDQKWLITGLIDIYLVNNTSWDVLYNLFLPDEQEKLRGKDYGSVFADTHLLLATIDRDALSFWLNGEIQLLFHKDRPGEIFPPFNAGFRIQGQKFYQEGNYKETFLDMGKGIIVRIFSAEDLKQSAQGQPKKTEKKLTGKAEETEDLILRHKSGEREAEVDLHIHELVEDFTGFEKGEVLEFQLSYAKECLRSAIARHYLKVTLIHGVGEGILRERLKEMIAKMFENLQVLNAPMDKYGVGAIEVRIPHNK